jgi:DNA-binding NarL/FixJ family response regulator
MILNSSNLCEVVGEAGDGQEAFDKIAKLKPDIAILDISMPSLSGIELARKIRKYFPQIKIIMLSRHDNEEYVRQLLKSGIHGFVLKDEAGNDMMRALDAVMKNETYLSPRITKKIMENIREGTEKRKEDPFDILTNREREILKLIAEGRSSEEIGKKLVISASTVKVHRANIMRKLDIHKATDMVKYAIKEGIVET